MPKRQIKKTVISYTQQKQDQPGEGKGHRERSRQKQREKQTTVQVVSTESRRAKLAALKKKQQKVENEENLATTNIAQPINIRIESDIPTQQAMQQSPSNHFKAVQQQKQPEKSTVDMNKLKQPEEQSDSEENANKVLLKPVFLGKEDRVINPSNVDKPESEEASKRALRFTTKMLLQENQKNQNERLQDDQLAVGGSSDEETRPAMPDDSDDKNQEMQYELWKIRELKRIRRAREERRKAEKEKAELERRRKMNNEEILLENKVMGSDATKNTTQTKYVYMQKYYHQGAFYRDSEDPIFNRDYNLPTPLQMQDKSMLPEILQKRKGDFGKKGQSKYKHLSAEDTTNFNPQFRADQSILNSFKRKMGGYKGTHGSNL